MIPNGWERISAEGRILGVVERPLHLVSVPWSPSTSKGGVRGEIVMVTDLAADKLEAQRERLRGRIVLIDSGTLFQPSAPRKIAKVFDQIRAAYPIFEKAGVVGLLWAGLAGQQRAQAERRQVRRRAPPAGSRPRTSASKTSSSSSASWSPAQAPSPPCASSSVSTTARADR